jgi:type I restriction enzyme S subunit
MSEVVERGNREKQGDDQLPEGWVWTTIGSVSETTSGGTPLRDREEFYGGTIPWVKSGELNDKLITSVEEHITEEALNNSSAKIFPKDTPLVALYGATIGKTGLLGIEAATNQAICAIFPQKDAFIPDFILYWLRYQRSNLIELGAGGAQPNISQQIIRSFHFPLAPLSEQNRIVDAIETQFTRLDAAVKALERAEIKLERYRASVLQAACEGRLVPTEAALARHVGGDREHPYEPAEQLLERILAERRRKWEEERWEYEIERAKKKAAQAERKAAGLPYYIRELEPEHWQDRAPEEYEPYLPKSDKWKEKYDEPEPSDTEDLPALPEGWCWVNFDQITHLITKGSSPNWQGFEYKEEGVLFIRSQNVRWGHLDLESVEYLSKRFNEEQSRSVITYGDVLLNIVGASIGRAAQVTHDLDGGNLNQAVAIIRPVETFMAAAYLVIYLISSRAQERIQQKIVDVARANLSLSDIKAMNLPLPPLAEQRRIVTEVERRLSIIDTLEETVSVNLTRAERMRQAILKKAFEGRLVEQRPEEGDARVLLSMIEQKSS